MTKVSKYLISFFLSYAFVVSAYAQVTIYTPKNHLGWKGFDMDYVSFDDNNDYRKTSNEVFDKRMKTQVAILNSYHSDKLKFEQRLTDQLQAQCDFLADATKLIAVYSSRYPKLLQQPDAKTLFLKSREYLDNFKNHNSKCDVNG
ncbi:hypothetical protein [uncultured Acinetobacter sp.]|uniref:hypothetical protein n=1 Tax=uncultured Acinetobacter sp. TaxID=165433 RepID=UPI00258A170E|nr:hypothetical protein [uncultured Acinetobacter sp.]